MSRSAFKSGSKRYIASQCSSAQKPGGLSFNQSEFNFSLGKQGRDMVYLSSPNNINFSG
jgi:hypothetical protein